MQPNTVDIEVMYLHIIPRASMS